MPRGVPNDHHGVKEQRSEAADALRRQAQEEAKREREEARDE